MKENITFYTGHLLICWVNAPKAENVCWRWACKQWVKETSDMWIQEFERPCYCYLTFLFGYAYIEEGSGKMCVTLDHIFFRCSSNLKNKRCVCRASWHTEWLCPTSNPSPWNALPASAHLHHLAQDDSRLKCNIWEIRISKAARFWDVKKQVGKTSCIMTV